MANDKRNPTFDEVQFTYDMIDHHVGRYNAWVFAREIATAHHVYPDGEMAFYYRGKQFAFVIPAPEEE